MEIINFFVKIFIVFLVSFIFLYIVGKISYPGAVGLRPIDDGCYGITLNNDEVYGKFPEGRVWVKIFNIEYYIPKKVENKSPEGFCFGKNFWDKERREKLKQETIDKNMQNKN